MQQHRGEIVEKAVRNSGLPIKKLAERLGISRNTLYSRFRDPEVSYKFIAAVSNVVHYDFLIDFPELEEGVQVGKGAIDYCKRDTVELARPDVMIQGRTKT